MTLPDLPDLGALLERRDVLVGVLAASVLLLVAVARRIRRVARSDRPDEPLSNLAMIIGLSWSSEAVWELTGRAGFPLSLRLLMFFVLETLLGLAMIRAKRAMRELGHPGRSGRTAWIVASAMALVAAAVAHTFAERVLRLLVPLLVTLAWWDGLVGEGARRRTGQSSWRWTPRRLLLAVGAIEPGERDVETVHRERLTQLMTRLEFRRRHGWSRLTNRRAARLARLSITADDPMITEVRARVTRALWFEQDTPAGASTGMRFDYPRPIGPEPLPGLANEPFMIRFDYERPVGPMPAPRPPDERRPARSRTAAERVNAAHRRTPKATHEQIAERAKVSVSTVKRHRPTSTPTGPVPAGTVNGHRPTTEVGVTA